MSDSAPWEDIEWAIPEVPVNLSVYPEFMPLVEAALREVDPDFYRDYLGRINVSDPSFVTKAQELAFIALGIPHHKGTWEEYREVALGHGYTQGVVV